MNLKKLEVIDGRYIYACPCKDRKVTSRRHKYIVISDLKGYCKNYKSQADSGA